jgi:hypothetical protein
MERIEDLVHPDAPKACYSNIQTGGRQYAEVWLPSLPLPFYSLRARIADAIAVFRYRATAVQWPHQRDPR